jgi:hypothetical protein
MGWSNGNPIACFPAPPLVQINDDAGDEEDAGRAVVHAAREHEKVGTFGYRMLNEEPTHVEKIVDEAGNYLPPAASYEVVYNDLPLPAWAKKGKLGRGPRRRNAIEIRAVRRIAAMQTTSPLPMSPDYFVTDFPGRSTQHTHAEYLGPESRRGRTGV